MIDIHCHILAGIDDGAADDGVSLAMARQAVSEGITQIVATPHHRNRSWDNPKPRVLEKVAVLNAYLQQEDVDLSILPGQEVRIFGEMSDIKEMNELLTVNDRGKYILVEFPTHQVPHYARRLFYDLQVSGTIPIIVHPERNDVLSQHPEMLYEFVNNGVLSQITAASLAGVEGKKLQKLCFQLIENNLTHFIASDAHNVTRRPFYMKKAFAVLENKFGRVQKSIFADNAAQMIDGQLLYPDPPTSIKRQKIFGLF
ncbi:MAG: CpsB/CapC family capsule biosynthesis tyrosine phosphatase [Sporolactobacillus sp.]